MRHTNYRTLIDRGRKAGLKTNDLYAAISSRRPDIDEALASGTDENGYVPDFQNGRRIYHPANERLSQSS
ncbi:MAG: hypothetical protein KatS3mg105_2424 [Gemmatales bacterium]|nr:MAG: hypothetical protein KatS3mg105_2424 [Gemmatales bacterium]